MSHSGIQAVDEDVHPVGEGKSWQESWYFNFSDPTHDLFGLTRIGFNFRTRKIDGLILTIRDGQPDFLYPAVHIPYKGDWNEQVPSKGLVARKLSYVCEEPLKKWRLTLDGKSNMDITWEAFTPPFDYHEDTRDLPPNVTGRHFEQSGTVTGHIHFKGKTFKINGTGERDKSWGVRDWEDIEGWDWVSVQFGEALTFNIWQGFFNGKCYQNGFVFEDGKNHPVKKFTIEYESSPKNHTPSGATLKITYGSQSSILSVKGEALGCFPLIKKGLFIQETHAFFSGTKDGKEIKGIGVIEHTFHVKKRDILKQLPYLFKTIAYLLV